MKVVLIPQVEMKYFPSEFNKMLFSLCGFPQKPPLWGISRQSLGKGKDPGSFWKPGRGH